VAKNMPQPTPYNTPTIINNAPNITASHYMAHIGSRKVLWWNARAGYMHKCIFVDVGWVGGVFNESHKMTRE